MPIGLLLVLLYTLLGNWPVFAYLPPLGRFTTLCNRPCSLWCTSGLDLACQSPLCKESQDFPQQSPGWTPRLWLCRPPWLDHASRDDFHLPSPDPPLRPEPLTSFCQQCTHFKAWRWGNFEKEKDWWGSSNSRTKGQKFRENEVWALNPALFSPDPQRGVPFPKGTQGNRLRPKTRFLGISLLYWGDFPWKPPWG